jgi:hypothetical protein
MPSRSKTALAALALSTLVASGAFAAEVSKSQCIPLMEIDHTTVVDEKTILVNMKIKDAYKRIDLLNSCPGLKFRGFAHKTSINQLCNSDTLTVIEPVGATCMIDKIVNISPEEAKALQARK